MHRRIRLLFAVAVFSALAVTAAAAQEPGAVLLGCHLHGSMRGHLFVTDSAYTLKTDADGIARFDQIPEGAAQLRVWHPEQLVDLPRRALQIGAAPVLESVPLSVRPPAIASAAPTKPSRAASTCAGRSTTPGSSTGASTTMSSGHR